MCKLHMDGDLVRSCAENAGLSIPMVWIEKHKKSRYRFIEIWRLRGVLFEGCLPESSIKRLSQLTRQMALL